MIKLFKYLRLRDWLLILFGVIFVTLSVWLDLLLPDYINNITQVIMNDTGSIELLRYGLYMLLCAFGSVAAIVVVGYIAARVGSGFSRRLRSLVYDKVHNFGLAEINKFSTPSLITRSTNDIVQVQMMVTMGLQVAIKAPILAIWALAKISDSSVEWTTATAIAVSILVLMFVIILTLAMPKFRKMQALTDDINRVARENLTGLSIVRAYNAEPYQIRKFEKTNKELTYVNMFASRAMAFTIPTISTIMSFITLVVYWIGAYLIDSAGAGPQAGVLFANMIVFGSYAMQILLAVMMITMWFIILPRSQVSAKRINEVLDTPISIRNGKLRQGRLGVVGEVEFVNVGFKYSEAAEPVLQNISFSAKRGQTVAFIGSTGSGKSTLINMVPRFYDAKTGQVLVNGVDVKDYDTKALYNKIGYISQKAVMFDGTIRSNIAMGSLGEYMTDEDIYRGLDIAQGAEFVSKLPEGIDSYVARGGNFSGGQKQRLSIARAIAKCPEILIFDDSFSALDYKTDRNLRAAIKQSTGDSTVLVVAQRIGTIMDADQIIVLNEGKMVGKGKHKELLENCPVYLEIARSQLSEEELAR